MKIDFRPPGGDITIGAVLFAAIGALALAVGVMDRSFGLLPWAGAILLLLGVGLWFRQAWARWCGIAVFTLLPAAGVVLLVHEGLSVLAVLLVCSAASVRSLWRWDVRRNNPAAGHDATRHDAAGHDARGHDAAGHDARGHDAESNSSDETVRHNSPRTDFADPPLPAITSIDGGPRLRAAVNEARRRWPEFVAAFQRRQPDERCRIMATVSDREGTECLWLDVSAIENGIIYGVLDSRPTRLRNLRRGERLRVHVEEVHDWLYKEGPQATGGFTTAVRDQP